MALPTEQVPPAKPRLRRAAIEDESARDEPVAGGICAFCTGRIVQLRTGAWRGDESDPHVDRVRCSSPESPTGRHMPTMVAL